MQQHEQPQPQPLQEQAAAQSASTRSQRILGSAAQSPCVSAAKTTMAQFERLWSATRVLAEDHPSRADYFQSFIDHVAAYVSEFDALTLTVTPHALMMDGVEVLKLTRNEENYVHLLHQDGIRRLHLLADLDQRSVAVFVKALRTNFAHRDYAEDDIVTLLWEADLKGIGYVAVDRFMEGEEDGAESQVGVLSADDVMEAALKATPITDIALDAQELVRKELSYALDLRGATPEAIEAAETAQEDETERAESVYGAGATNRRVLAERQRLADAAAGRKFGEICFRVLDSVPGGQQRQVLRAFSGFSLLVLEQGNDALLWQVLQTAEHIAEQEHQTPLYRALLYSICTPANAKALLQHALQPRAEKETLTLIEAMATLGLQAMWAPLLSFSGAGPRRRLRDLLAPFAKQHVDFLLKQMGEDNIDAALLAISLLREVKESAVYEQLLGGLRHPAAEVRRSVVESTGRAALPQVRTALPKMLEDRDESVRMAALLALGAHRDAQVEAALVRYVSAPAFARREIEERRIAFASLNRISGERGLALVRDIAFAAGAAGKQADADTRVLAIQTLGARRDTDSLEKLRALANKTLARQALRKAAQQAADAIGSTGGER